MWEMCPSTQPSKNIIFKNDKRVQNFVNAPDTAEKSSFIEYPVWYRIRQADIMLTRRAGKPANYETGSFANFANSA